MHIEIRTVAIDQLEPHPANPRVTLVPAKHREYQAIKTSLDRYGLVEPIVWNERTGRIVSGHQRVRVLRNQHVRNVDVAVVDLDEHEEAALLLAMNKIEGRWDPDKLAALVEDVDPLFVNHLADVDVNSQLAGMQERRYLCNECGTVWYE